MSGKHKHSDDSESGSDRNSKHHKKDSKKEKSSSHKDKKKGDDTKKQKVSVEISIDDYFLKNAEFRLWLLENKKIYFDSLKSEEAREYFEKFVSKWNKNKLEEKFYRGVETAARTKFAWGFKEKLSASDNSKLNAVKSSVGVSSHAKYEDTFKADEVKIEKREDNAYEIKEKEKMKQMLSKLGLQNKYQVS